jgi:hypothetical protein
MEVYAISNMPCWDSWLYDAKTGEHIKEWYLSLRATSGAASAWTGCQQKGL